MSIHPTGGITASTPFGNVYNVSSVEEAQKIYKEAKEKRCKELAEEYKEVIPNEVYEIMINWECIE